MNNTRNRIPIFYLLLFGVLAVWLVIQLTGQTAQQEPITLNELASDIQAGDIARLQIQEDDTVAVTYKSTGEEVTTETLEVRKEPSTTLIDQLLALGVSPEQLAVENVKIEVVSPSALVRIFNILAYLLPVILLVIVFWFVFRQAQGSNNAAISFGKSRARMFSGDHPTITFDDVAGVEEAKEDLMEVVEFLKEPEKFIALGARIPKGVLLVGQPGTGKTLMAKAVSGEAGVPFFSISGSEFVEMFVGVGASRVRDLFDQAKRHSPCIVFVDEIDAVGRQRGAGLGGSHDEREQTLNQILVEMDGFDTDTNIIIIAATNRPDILDPALMRPGRFDRRVVLDRPDVRGREAILKVHTRGKPIDSEVDLSQLARATPGFVGADLENLVNEAAILSARRNKKSIGQSELQEAIERIMAGPERKSRLISAPEKIIIAYHEAGHAICSHVLPNADPVYKVTIIPRGMALGYMWGVPEEDREMVSKSKLLDSMVTTLGGRAAEELIFDDITSGASSDLQKVTQTARNMVMRLGMSKELGTRVYGQKDELVFLGREISEQKDYSEAIAEKIDSEVLELVNEAYEKAKEVLIKYQDKHHEIAQKLLEVETLSRDEFEEIFPSPVDKRIGGTPVRLNGSSA
ncbi:MAG TPA: ATP-dependent zinc metalloprotease FtsH [Anaerolineales bacterium]|nr:ATP-dependent zinc metalloprotease FtsH [Anaerolineales bacterium]